MKYYKVVVRATATVRVTEDEWKKEGGIGEFTDFEARQYAKAVLCERMRNDPNVGSCKIEKRNIAT